MFLCRLKYDLKVHKILHNVLTSYGSVIRLETDFFKCILLQVYRNILNCVLNKLVPLVTLIILNYYIYKALKTQKKLRDRFSNKQRLSSVEIRMTRISILIVLVFIFCHFPRIVPNIFDLILIFVENDEQVIFSNHF